MGYDVELVFDPEEGYDPVVLRNRFIQAGGEVYEDPRDPNPGFFFDSFGTVIWLARKEGAIAKGRWAFLRCPRTLDGLMELMSLAASVGGQVYDANTGEFLVDEAAARRTLESLEKEYKVIAGLFGTVNRGGGQSQAEEGDSSSRSSKGKKEVYLTDEEKQILREGAEEYRRLVGKDREKGTGN